MGVTNCKKEHCKAAQWGWLPCNMSLPENRSGSKRSTRCRKRAVEKLKEKAAKRGKARGSDGSLKPPPAGLKTPPKQMPLLSPSQHAGYERTFVHGSAFVHRHRLVHQSEFVRSCVQVVTALKSKHGSEVFAPI